VIVPNLPFPLCLLPVLCALWFFHMFVCHCVCCCCCFPFAVKRCLCVLGIACGFVRLCVFVRVCLLVMPGDVHFFRCHGILPLWCAVIIWGRCGCVCPVINVFHNEIATLPMSMNGLCSAGECVFIFSFQVNKLPSASSLVDLNPFVGPC
jgi:hypothetical protein